MSFFLPFVFVSFKLNCTELCSLLSKTLIVASTFISDEFKMSLGKRNYPYNIIRIKRKKEVQKFKISHSNIVKHIQASNITRQIKTPDKTLNILHIIKGL